MIYRISMQSTVMTAIFGNSLAMRANSRLRILAATCFVASLLFALGFACAKVDCANLPTKRVDSSGTIHIAPGAQYEWRDPDLKATASSPHVAAGTVGITSRRVPQAVTSTGGIVQMSKRVSLPQIATFTLRRFFKLEPKDQGLEAFAAKVKCDPSFRKPAGVFVTISKNGATRACWGTVYAQQADIVRETIFSTLGALSKEYRFRPIRKSELPDLKIQVSIIRDITAISGFSSVNPLKDGIMVRSGGRSGVILPGEATDAYYEFVLARLKAGIKPGEACQIYKLRTDIYD